MPIYEYECPKCGIFEVTQKVSEKPLSAKPECSEKNCPNKAERIISAPAFHLKGTGWYKTDYASSSAGGTKSKAAAKESTESSSTSSTESSSSSSSGGESGDTNGDKKKGPCGSGCGCH